MTDDSPKVSIIIPCWNASLYIADAIGSCLYQSYKNLEVIIVNDGSTDGSDDIIDLYRDQVVAIDVPNGGANKARNIGFDASSGDLIKFLDADDFLWPGAISRQVEHIQRLGKNFISVGESFKYDEGGVRGIRPYPTWTTGGGVPEEVSRFILLPPAISNVLYRREQLNHIGCFDEEISVRQEVDLFFRCIFSGNVPSLIKIPVFIYRDHNSDGRVSRTKLSKAYLSDIKLLMRAVEKLDSVQGMFEFGKAREALALGVWNMARDMLRNGYRAEAETLFLLAERCNSENYIMGRAPYKRAVQLMGPYRAESLFTFLKSALMRKTTRVQK